MANLKQFSMKIDPSALDAADAFVRRNRYWYRNAVLNGILAGVLLNADDDTILKLLRFFPQRGDQLRIVIEECQEDGKEVTR